MLAAISRHGRARSKARSAGFGLIEVLVSLVLLSVGLLGLAGLQTDSLRNNESALVRSRAIAMAYDMLDQIRANRTAADNGAYSGINTQAGGKLTGYPKTWADEVKTLPGGTAKVTKNAANGTFTVIIEWTENWDKSRGADNATRSVTLNTQPWSTWR